MVGAVSSAIKSGIAFLASAQQKDGSFESFSSEQMRPFTPVFTYRTTFTPAIILGALQDVPEAHAIRKAAAGWLVSQKSEQWSFNYWAVGSLERQTLPYPDDLDDTFCALRALHSHDPALIDGEVLGHAVRLLVAVENKVGGPYGTWLVAKTSAKKWRDVDLAVNANVAAFLQQVAEPLPSLQRLMERAIVLQKLVSPYYPSFYPVAYYVARAYLGPKKQLLAEQLLDRQKDGVWDDSPLHTALAVSSLLRLGYPVAKLQTAIDLLLRCQAKDGSWPAEGFCLDPLRNGKIYGSGAASLTTALVLEVLHQYHAEPSEPIAQDREVPAVYQKIVDETTAFFASLDGVLGREGHAALSALLKSRSHQEIILLPHMVAMSLRKPLTQKATGTLIQLGLANVYGWIAYTVYDDFLDDEGRPLQLSVANVSMRASVRSFEKALPAHRAFQTLVHETFNTIDAANAWEVAHCRWQVTNGRISVGSLPKYGALQRLAERSLGHALTPLGVLAAAGMGPDTSEAGHLLKALRHYLIARQLSDDMHDWERDVSVGHVSFVVAAIARELNIAAGTHVLKTLLPQMQRHFWHHSLGPLCELVKKHIVASRKHLALANVLSPGNGLELLLKKLETAMEETLCEQKNAKQFLRTYQRK